MRLLRVPRWRWLAALALLWPALVTIGAFRSALAEDDAAEVAATAAEAAAEVTAPAVEDGAAPTPASPAISGLAADAPCAGLVRALRSQDRATLTALWTRHPVMPPATQSAAIDAALELGGRLAEQQLELAGGPGACQLAPFERDRFGWVSRQNQLSLVATGAPGPPSALRFDLVREDGQLRLTGEVRVLGGGGGGTRFRATETGPGSRALSLLGIPFLLGVAWLLSTDRRRINWRTVLWGVGLQMVLGLIVLSPGAAEFFFDGVDAGVKRLLSFAEIGADFVFQAVVPHLIFTWDPATNTVLEGVGHVGSISAAGKSLAFWILPTIVFFSSLMTILYHLGVMQWVVRGCAWAMQKTMRTSGSETLSSAANIFVGQTEAPLVVKPFVKGMTVSELHAVMTGGFATVAGGVLAAYVGFLRDIPGIAGHLVTASIMSAPAALAVAKILYPETEQSQTSGAVQLEVERPDRNVIEAAARGASEGMTLMLNVIAMLIAFVGLMAMVNYLLGLVGTSLEALLGYAFSPFAFMMGVPWEESAAVGELLGKKIVLTEFVAYLELGGMIAAGDVLSERSAVIASYALCGFANFASIGIQLGGIGGIAPSRRGDLARVCLRAMFGGFLAANMTGTIAGLLV